MLAPDMLVSQPSALKVADFSLVSKKKLEPKMADWICGQGRVKVAKKRKNTPTCDVPHRELQTQNEKKLFFKVN